VGGDDEPPLLLKSLAERNPDHEFVLVGRNSGERPEDVGLPSNVTNPWTDLRDELRIAFDKHDQPTNILGDDLKHVLKTFSRYTVPLFQGVDQLIVWGGQHGTSQTPIPKIGKGWDDVTNPQKSFVLYASYVVRGINAYRAADPIAREEQWLCPDPRNYLKARDVQWPLRHPFMAQFEFSKREKHERYNDTRTPAECGFEAEVDSTGHVWHARHRYIYSGLELCGILPEHVPSYFADNWEERQHFGLFINEARAYVKVTRLDALKEYVLPLDPHFIHGKWSAESLTYLASVGREIAPAPSEVYYDKLRSVKSTFTTPSSGSGWATTKPWQAFGTGTVCFFHPGYDTQGHIIPTLEQVEHGDVVDPDLATLARWLRVTSPDDLAVKVKVVDQDRDTWLWLALMQRKLYDDACRDPQILRRLEKRLQLK